MAQPNHPILLANAHIELCTCRVDSSSLEHVVPVESRRTSRTDFRPMDLFSYLHVLWVSGKSRQRHPAPHAARCRSFGGYFRAGRSPDRSEEHTSELQS